MSADFAGTTERLDFLGAVDGLADDIAIAGGIMGCLADLNTRYQQLPIYEVLNMMSGVTEPINPISGKFDPETPCALAFLGGTLLGMRAVELTQGESILHYLEPGTAYIDVNPEVTQTRDELVIVREMGEAAKTMGDGGLELVPEQLHDSLSEWDALVAQQLCVTEYFRRGFGFSLMIAKNAIERRKREAFEAFLCDAGVDSDDMAAVEAGLLADMLGDEETS